MNITGTISFRVLLVERVEEFVNSTELQPLVTQESITALVSASSNYTEEGQTFSPAIYATSSIIQLLKIIPGSIHIKIGNLTDSAHALCLALKKCAPLARDGWCIYVCHKDNETTFGLFSDSQFPLNTPLDQTLLNVSNDMVKILKVQQTAPNCIELANHKGDSHTVYLSDKKESEKSPRTFIKELTDVICFKLSPKIRLSIQTVIEKTLTDGLDSSHGALIAVTTDKNTPQFLCDGTLLEKPIDFSELVNKAVQKNIEDSLRLTAFTQILKGMFNCDGIMVFSPYGQLIGYNCFIKSALNSKDISGGARKRAFASLESKIDNGICAAYIRSHDGWSKITKSNKI